MTDFGDLRSNAFRIASGSSEASESFRRAGGSGKTLPIGG